MDLVIYGLPIKDLWGLQMGKGKRVRLCALFLLGGVSCLCGLAKCVLSFEAGRKGKGAPACKWSLILGVVKWKAD